MKKKLEADLISIAHRILKIKNKSDINQLYLETQKLYEKLAVLKFVQENFDELKPTIQYNELENQVETIFNEQEKLENETQDQQVNPIAIVEEVIETETISEPEAIQEAIQEEVQEEVTESITEISETIEEEQEEILIEVPVAAIEEIVEEVEEPLVEAPQEINPVQEFSFKTVSDIKPILDFKPAFELSLEEPEVEEIEEPVAALPKVEEEVIEEVSRPEAVHISFEDILGVNYADAQFVKVESYENVSPVSPSLNIFEEKKTTLETAVFESEKTKAVPLNEKLAKGFHVDLNDRIAFTINLFGNNTEDYSRVLNQLLTFDNYAEAHEFIETMVKPDYNNWEGKDDYALRFLDIVEKKFA